MTRKVKSIKGETVDFDLFDIKEQISSSPKTPDVLMRESYIDIKRRRASRKDMAQLLAEQEKNRARVRRALDNKVGNVESVEDVNVPEESVASTEDTKVQTPKKRPVRRKK